MCGRGLFWGRLCFGWLGCWWICLCFLCCWWVDFWNGGELYFDGWIVSLFVWGYRMVWYGNMYWVDFVLMDNGCGWRCVLFVGC